MFLGGNAKHLNTVARVQQPLSNAVHRKTTAIHGGLGRFAAELEDLNQSLLCPFPRTSFAVIGALTAKHAAGPGRKKEVLRSQSAYECWLTPATMSR